MIYTDNYFFLCRIPLSAEGASDVEVLGRAKETEDFPELFKQYEEKRRHAFNDDGLYSIVRADEIHHIVRSTSDEDAKQKAFEESQSSLITNLEHRVMQNKDKHAAEILQRVHEREIQVQ